MSNNFTQILIRSDDNQKIPNILKYKIENIKKLYSECNHTLYNNEMIREFISYHFDKNTLNAYDTLKPYAYKCDLARYCITYINGGWYADITTDAILKMNNYLDFDFICFYDNAYEAGGYQCQRWDYASSFKFGIQNSFFYTKSKNIILEKTINLIIDNCKNKFYGLKPHMPTGPGALSISYLQNADKLELIHEGMHVALTPRHKYPNYSYILSDGRIVAYYKDRNNKEYEFEEKFDYRTLWKNKNVYGELN